MIYLQTDIDSRGSQQIGRYCQSKQSALTVSVVDMVRVKNLNKSRKDCERAHLRQCARRHQSSSQAQ